MGAKRHGFHLRMSVATTPDDSLGPPGPPVHARWLPAVEVALIFLVFAAQAGWPAPDVNEPHYLGKAKHYWNPAWAPHDFFFESADTHLMFYVACGWLTRWLTLPQFAWCGRAVTWLLLAWAWRRLSWAVVPRPGWAVATSFVFVTLNVGCQLAGEWVVGGFEAKGLAYVLVLAAVRAYLAERWNAALALAGASAALHVLVGGWLAVALGFCWLISPDRPPLRRLRSGLLAGFLLSLAGVWPALALNWGVEPQLIAEANDIYVFRRLRHHLAPQAFGWWPLARYLAMLIAWLVFARLTARLCRERTPWHSAEGRDNVKICRERTPCRSAAGRDNVDSQNSERHGGRSLQASSEMPPVLPVATDPHSLEHRLENLRRLVVASLAISLAGMAIAVTTVDQPELAAALLRYYWFRLADVMPPIGIALMAGAYGASLVRGRRIWPAGCLLVSLALTAANRQEYAIAGLFRNVPRGDRSNKVLDHADWRDACQWIAQHTPDDALVLTPRTAQTFTWYAGRGEVVSWKDLPQDAVAIFEWWQRLEDLHGTPQPEAQGRWHESLTELPVARLRKLGDKYGANFLLTEAEPRLLLPRRYKNKSYAIYEF